MPSSRRKEEPSKKPKPQPQPEPSSRRKADSLNGFFDASDESPRRRRVVGVAGTGPSGPAMKGAGAPRGPSGPAMSGGAAAAAPVRRRRGGADDDLLKQLYG